MVALKEDGHAWAWGGNSSGEVGDGTRNINAGKSSPVSVVGGHLFTKVTAGGGVSAAIDEDGYAWTWGTNARGALGIGTKDDDQSSPVSVIGGHQFIDIRATNRFVHALKDDGSLWAWGENAITELGIGLFGGVNDQSSPVSVVRLFNI